MKISTHTSRVGCDLNSWCLVQHHIISTHTSRVGCDKILEDAGVEVTFLLTHPVWDVTLFPKWKQPIIFYFYSHIPCGMWQEPSWESLDLLEISTHTSRVGCDTVNGADNPEEWGFLLTHPVWDVTPNRTRKRPTMRKISTHTSRVGCDRKTMSHTVEQK